MHLVFVTVICSILCSFALAIGTLFAARWLHLTMLANIFHAPMSFFDTTPTGRVVNRFSKDIDTVDNTLPNNISAFLNCFFQVSLTMYKIFFNNYMNCMLLFIILLIPTKTLSLQTKTKTKTLSPLKYIHLKQFISR